MTPEQQRDAMKREEDARAEELRLQCELAWLRSVGMRLAYTAADGIAVFPLDSDGDRHG